MNQLLEQAEATNEKNLRGQEAQDYAKIVAVGMKKDGRSVAFLVALGEMNEKVRATLLASGIPEGLIDTKAAVIGVSVNNVQLKGDELDEFAEAIKTARDKKAPPPSLKSLADLSK